MKNTASRITSNGQLTVPHYIRIQSGFNIGDAIDFEVKDLMDYVGFLGKANLPDDMEELLSPEVTHSIMERG